MPKQGKDAKLFNIYIYFVIFVFYKANQYKFGDIKSFMSLRFFSIKLYIFNSKFLNLRKFKKKKLILIYFINKLIKKTFFLFNLVEFIFLRRLERNKIIYLLASCLIEHISSLFFGFKRITDFSLANDFFKKLNSRKIRKFSFFIDYKKNKIINSLNWLQNTSRKCFSLFKQLRFYFFYAFFKYCALNKKMRKRSFFGRYYRIRRYLTDFFFSAFYYCFLKKKRSNSFITLTNFRGEVVFTFSTGRLPLIRRKFKKYASMVKQI